MAAAIGEVAYKTRLRRKAERSAQELAVAVDRERIARDLHDTVGQTLYGMGLKLQDLIAESASQEEVTEALQDLRRLASQGVTDVRSAVYALSFAHVRERGLVPSIEILVREFMKATGVYAHLRVQDELPALNDEAQSVLYRVAHEALVNVERHARATGVIVSVTVHKGEVELSIRDDGVALGQREARDWRTSVHLGVRMMAKSVEEIGGRFHAEPTQPRGFHIVARVPASVAPLRGVRGRAN
jgi:two-component system sensor histidine kinase UhpB